MPQRSWKQQAWWSESGKKVIGCSYVEIKTWLISRLSECVRVSLVTNARSMMVPSNVYRLEDCVLVSCRSLCGERKINGSMACFQAQGWHIVSTRPVMGVPKGAIVAISWKLETSPSNSTRTYNQKGMVYKVFKRTCQLVCQQGNNSVRLVEYWKDILVCYLTYKTVIPMIIEIITLIYDRHIFVWSSLKSLEWYRNI